MYALEAAFLVVSVALVLTLIMPRAGRRVPAVLAAAGLVVAVAAFALGQARIHMAPAAIVFAISSLLLLKRSYSHAAIRTAGAAVGLLPIAASVFLAFALPVVTLPAPDGPYAVGVASFTVVDESRNDSYFGAPDSSREIYVQVWYPGEMPEAGPRPRARTLWQELYPPGVLNVLFGYLGGMETHSYEGLAVSSASREYPAVVFSPSLAGIAEQNTLLMEHLASHGYVVLGVTHPHFGIVTVYPDDRRVPASGTIMEAMAQQGEVGLDALAARAERSATARERAAIWLEYFEQGDMLNELMDILVDDLRLLLDTVSKPGGGLVAEVPAIGRFDSGRIGLLGMSVGGGAVTELCKQEPRCRAVMNIDGGLWGSATRQAPRMPYLVLASPGNERFFEHDLLTSEAPYYLLTVDGAAHASFTDVSVFVPLFQWLGITGAIDGQRVIDIMNTVTKNFFDAYLRGVEPRAAADAGTQAAFEAGAAASVSAASSAPRLGENGFGVEAFPEVEARSNRLP